MLELLIPSGQELFDEENNRFLYSEEKVLRLEHSLASLSKWEAIHEKPFLGDKEKTPDEIVSYIKCMAVDNNLDDETLNFFTKEHFDTIQAYINRKHSATWFSETRERGSSEAVTAELIYYWMSALQIPFECENWNLNKLFNLIKIAGIKNAPEKKMSKSQLAQRNRELNAQRRAALGTSG